MNLSALLIANCPTVGHHTHRKLWEFFGDFEAAWTASPERWREAGLRQKSIESLLKYREGVRPEVVEELFAQSGARLMTLADADYPELLRQTADGPVFLFIKGDAALLTHEPLLSVVGSREATAYGFACTRTLVGPCVQAGVTVVSGLAHGIDEAAHRVAMEAGGRTVAILGTGLCAPQSSRSRELIQKILAGGGAVISEFPLTLGGTEYTFPMRNRIIAGLTRATLVIEAGEKSGSMITARLANEENRDVLAVPGPISSAFSLGTNALLKNGAHLVTESTDILSILGMRIDSPRAQNSLASPQNTHPLLPLIPSEGILLDALISKMECPPAQRFQEVTQAEIEGFIENIEGVVYRTLRVP